MALTIDVSAAADVNPYVLPTGWTYAKNNFKVVSGALRSGTDISIALVNSPPTSGVMDVQWVTALASTGFSDTSGAVFATPSGNGYYACLDANRISVYVLTAGAIGTRIAQSGALTFAIGDTFTARYDLSTNTLTTYQNSVSTSVAVTTSTGLTAGAGFSNGCAVYEGNNNSAGIRTVTATAGATVALSTITTGGVSGLKVGQPFSFTTTGLTTATAFNIKTPATPAAQTNATGLSFSAGSGSGTVPFFADGAYVAFSGTVTGTVTGAEGSPTKSVPFSIPDDHIDVVFGVVSLQDNTYLGYALNAIGHPLAGGTAPDRAYWINTNNLVFGTDGKISCASAMTTQLWVHKASGIIEGYTVNITEAGSGSIVGRITSKSITSRALTSRSITQRL